MMNNMGKFRLGESCLGKKYTESWNIVSGFPYI